MTRLEDIYTLLSELNKEAGEMMRREDETWLNEEEMDTLRRGWTVSAEASSFARDAERTAEEGIGRPKYPEEFQALLDERERLNAIKTHRESVRAALNNFDHDPHSLGARTQQSTWAKYLVGLPGSHSLRKAYFETDSDAWGLLQANGRAIKAKERRGSRVETLRMKFASDRSRVGKEAFAKAREEYLQREGVGFWLDKKNEVETLIQERKEGTLLGIRARLTALMAEGAGILESEAE